MRRLTDEESKDFTMKALKQVGFESLESVNLIRNPTEDNNWKLAINCAGEQHWIVGIRISHMETVYNNLPIDEAAFSVAGILIDYADGKRHAIDSFSYIFICNEHNEAIFVKSNESRLHEKANQYNGWVFGSYR
jgi:hypothetical protein